MSNHPNYLKELKKKCTSNSEYFKAISKFATVLIRNKLPIILSVEHLSRLSGVPHSEIQSILNGSDLYRVFPIRKKSGGKRWIAAPAPTLMRLQKWISKNILYSNYSQRLISTDATAYLSKINHLENADRHWHNSELVKIDITRFFNAITIIL